MQKHLFLRTRIQAIVTVLSLATLFACAKPSPYAPTAGSSTNTTLPSPTSTSTPSPTPIPTPTPLPADLVRVGENAFVIGDTEEAILAFTAALAGSPDDELAGRALLGLGRSYLIDGAFGEASATFQSFVARFPDSPDLAKAHFFLAEAHNAQGDGLAAIAEYEIYLAQETTIAAYVQDWIGDTYRAAGSPSEAIAAYRIAVDQAPYLSFEVGVREKLALAYVALEDYEAALAQYDAILAQSSIAAYRARILHQTAQTMLLSGQATAGYTRHRQVVDTYPTSPWAYESLVVLVTAGLAVDDLTRGTVDYYGGAYGPATAALYRYINAYPTTHAGDAHYYAALSYMETDAPTLAEQQFRILVETHPGNDLVGDAWMGWAQALTAQGDISGAVSTYQDFAAALPGHSRAPEALWTAAQLLERWSRIEEAAEAYEACRATYPYSDRAAPALLRGGLQHYRLGDLQSAAADWQTLANEYAGSTYRAAGYLWLGKVHLALGQPLSATIAFSEAARVDPTGYYGLRAGDLALDPIAAPFGSVDYVQPTDPAGEQAAAEQWLADWLNLPSPQEIGVLDPVLATDGRLLRGTELWELGRAEEAKIEFESLRAATTNNPLAQYQLALFFRDTGLYRSSILAASRLITLSPAAGPLEAPAYLARLAYPVYYGDTLISNAFAEDLSPLLVAALIRQESLFEGFATSYAYAHGLMQVIPSTGSYIAGHLNWPPGYETADLYRPLVSIRFGTWYLARQRDYFGRLDAALAAYNGGPGNASTWSDAAGDDPDLFLEVITLGETRLYLLRIREHYAAYSALYGSH